MLSFKRNKFYVIDHMSFYISYNVAILIFFVMYLQCALVTVDVDEKKREKEREAERAERDALMVEIASLQTQLTAVRGQLADKNKLMQERDQQLARYRDESEALRFSNEMVVQMHAQQRGKHC